MNVEVVKRSKVSALNLPRPGFLQTKRFDPLKAFFPYSVTLGIILRYKGKSGGQIPPDFGTGPTGPVKSILFEHSRVELTTCLIPLPPEIARSPEELQLMLNPCQQWAEKNRMSINVNKTKIVVFLEDPATRKARHRFNFTLTPAFPIALPEATRIQIRQEVWLRKHTTSAIKESVRIPAGTLGLVVEVKENDTAIVEVVDLGQVELRVQDLTHVSLVINEVDCFKYLGLNLDYALRMEEATNAGVANIRFAHSKVAATLHSLHQLPRLGNNAALSPLMRLQM
jgi:hypothetical protein